MQIVRVGIVGDFDRDKHTHWAIEAALLHAAAQVGCSVEPEWVPTPALAAAGAASTLAGFDALWGAPGSPYASAAGMLDGITYVRTHDIPYLGTCGGFQYALIEFSRNVLGVADADSAENDPQGKNVVITAVNCEIPARGPRLHGAHVIHPTPGTLLAALCGPGELAAEYFCSFETNRDFVPRWAAAGLAVAARGADGEMRAFELPANRFFLATLFQPQLSSTFRRPHPIVTGLLKAAATAQAAS